MIDPDPFSMTMEVREILVMHFQAPTDDVWHTVDVMGKVIRVRRQSGNFHLTYTYQGDEWALTFLYGLTKEFLPFRSFFAGNRDAFDRDMMLIKVALP